MDIDAILGGDRGEWPLDPDLPFTTAQAHSQGMTYRQLRILVEGGVLRRPVKGVYVGADVADSPLLRAACLRLVVPAECVVVDRHAGWLHGAEMVLAPGEHLGPRPLSLYLPSGRGRLRNSLVDSGERNLRPRDVVEVDGVRVTTPLRTACDLGRVRWPAWAITGMSSMLRLRAFGRTELLLEVERYRRMRWVTTLRAVAPLADPRFESPPEAVVALRCYEVGLPVEPQLVVRRGGLFLARLDLGNEHLRLGIEYDGAEWHHSAEQLAHDRTRRAAVVEEGFLVEALRAEHVFGVHSDAERRLVDLHLRAQRRLRRTS